MKKQDVLDWLAEWPRDTDTPVEVQRDCFGNVCLVALIGAWHDTKENHYQLHCGGQSTLIIGTYPDKVEV